MSTVKVEEKEENILLGGGPLRYGDPDDKRLRKAEKDIILPKMIKEEASKRCAKTLQTFLECAKSAGFLVGFKCKAENNANNDCLIQWVKNPEFVHEMTNKYLSARSHFRSTGKPLEVYERKKKFLEPVSS